MGGGRLHLAPSRSISTCMYVCVCTFHRMVRASSPSAVVKMVSPREKGRSLPLRKGLRETSKASPLESSKPWLGSGMGVGSGLELGLGPGLGLHAVHLEILLEGQRQQPLRLGQRVCLALLGRDLLGGKRWG